MLKLKYFYIYLYLYNCYKYDRIACAKEISCTRDYLGVLQTDQTHTYNKEYCYCEQQVCTKQTKHLVLKKEAAEHSIIKLFLFL